MAVTAELLYDSSWQEVQAYEREGWKYKVGPSDITGMEPNSLEVTLANDDLSMDPSNVLSPLYGKIGPNTPVRLVDYTPGAQTAADTFDGRTVASGWGTSSGGQVWTTSGGSAADFSVSSGLGRMSLASINVSRRATIPGVVSGGDAMMLWTIDIEPTGDDIETTFMIHYQDASNYVQASIYWDRDGRPIELQFVRRQAGVVTQLGITHLTVSPAGAGYSCWMRVQWFGINMRMKVWPAATSQPVNWNLSALETVWSSGQVGIRANLQPLFSAGTPRLVTVDSFTLSAFSGRVMAVGEASSWRPETTVEHVPTQRGRSWVNVTADGIQRRIGRWDQPSESPLRRQISSYGSALLGYWSLEDAAGAQNLSNSVTAIQAYTGGPGYFSDEGVTLADDEGPAGSLAALTIEQGAYFGGRFIFDATTDGYQISWMMKLDATTLAAPYIAFFQWSDTMGRMWYWRTNNGAYEIGTYDEFGAAISTTTSTWGAGVDPTEWVRYRIKVSVTGSTVKYEPSWYPQDAAVVYGTSATFTNVSVGYPIAWRVAGNAYNDGAAYNHVFAVSDLSLDLISDYGPVAAFNAYNGETASARFVRLMKENGITQTWRGDTVFPAYLGRQPRGTLPELLEDLQVSEAGVIYDDPSQLRLVLRTYVNLLGQTPALALVKGTNLGYPLKKVIDDQRASNDITVTNWDGTTAQVTSTDGPRSVQAPPDGVGRYPGRLEVSFRHPENLAQRGNWELANNTLDRPRYPTVVVDLLANPSLKGAVTALRPGDLITISGEEPYPIPLLVVQIERVGDNVRDTATLSCIPGDLYSAGRYDDGVIRYDSGSTTLAADITTSGTSLSVKMATPDDRWKTAGGYDVMVNGERMTVSSVTAGSASGTGWVQTMTVVRSINGASRAHYIGEEVHVATPGTYVMKNRDPQ